MFGIEDFCRKLNGDRAIEEFFHLEHRGAGAARGVQARPSRQWPYRQGKYQRADEGSVCGTGSKPWLPKGRQRQNRASAIQAPAHKPWRAIASSAYSEQVGRCRQVRPTRLDSV